MIIKQALLAVLNGISIQDHLVEKAMIDQELEPGDTYTPADAKTIDLCAIDALQSLLAAAKVSEGGYSISYDVKGIQARISSLEAKHGLNSGQPGIRVRYVR